MIILPPRILPLRKVRPGHRAAFPEPTASSDPINLRWFLKTFVRHFADAMCGLGLAGLILLSVLLALSPVALAAWLGSGWWLVLLVVTIPGGCAFGATAVSLLLRDS